MTEESGDGWQWAETPEFVQDCGVLSDTLGEVDFLRGLIGDSILEDPINGSNPYYDQDDPDYDPDVRYFRTDSAPGLQAELDPKIVVFRLDMEAGRSTWLVTGLALWDDEEA